MKNIFAVFQKISYISKLPNFFWMYEPINALLILDNEDLER